MKSKSTAPREQERTLRLQREMVRLLGRFAVLAVLLWLVFGVLFGLCAMPDDQMAPRLYAGDLILYYRQAHTFHDRDVIVARVEGQTVVGRVAARGGDTVEISDGMLHVNGSTVMENEIYYTTDAYEGGASYPLTLKENELFLLCDHREGATDSRWFGPVAADSVKGRVITVLRRSRL